MTLSCGIGPIAICSRKRSFRNSLCWAMIFSATVSGSPTNSAPLWPARLVEMRPVGRSPAALAADPVHHLGLRSVEIVCGLVAGLRDEAMHVEAGGKPGGIMAGAPRRLAVKLEQRRKAGRLAADDGQRQRQPQRAGPHHRLRRAADGDPDRQLVLIRARIDAAIVDRRTQIARPADPFVFAQRQQQLELFGEQRVVVAEVVAEQREGFDERAAPRHDLGATARQQVEGGELLEDADRDRPRKAPIPRWSAGCSSCARRLRQGSPPAPRPHSPAGGARRGRTRPVRPGRRARSLRSGCAAAHAVRCARSGRRARQG